MRTKPTNFTLGVFKLRSTPFPSIPTDLDLFTTLTRGAHGTAMWPWPELGEKERWALVDYIKTLSPRFRDERPSKSIRVARPPRDDEALRERGKGLYASMECATCHGSPGWTGKGDGTFTKDARQWGAAAVSPSRDFRRGRFIRGAELEDIYLTLRTGLDGSTMGSYDALLSDAEMWAVAAYVRSLVRQQPVRSLPPAATTGTAAGALRLRHSGTRPANRKGGP